MVVVSGVEGEDIRPPVVVDTSVPAPGSPPEGQWGGIFSNVPISGEILLIQAIQAEILVLSGP
jgi:hypothetical protein